MRLGPKKRHVTDSLTLAKQVLDSNVECDKLEDSALICQERRGHLKLHLDSYKKLHIELEDAASQEFLPPLEVDINWFSTLHRLVCVTAWCMAFIVNLKGEQQRGPLHSN